MMKMFKLLALMTTLSLFAVQAAQAFILPGSDVIWKAGKPIENVTNNLRTLINLELQNAAESKLLVSFIPTGE